ncbi:nostrin-like isoform X2 [Paramacrobiotus metropolitanus]|uniref:nostrin-like isoform X2 n=1 Tax=Paramacrobiotus metropolitanus TaxID=2943436 RepID=UPI002445C941|nr:nostrin-like isoform X2 [Paramacrobiotus metropolitanus]
MSQGGTLRRSKSKSGLSLRLSFSRGHKSPVPGETKDDSGTNGFQELRKYIKQSAEFAKELTSILQERSELETTYAKGLSKISARLAKASKDAVGTLANAWIGIATEMEQEAELHRYVADFMQQEVAQPLRTLNETHTKSRKQIEAQVERADKALKERRADEFKVKRDSHTLSKELEKLQEQIYAVKLGKVKSSSEKEVGKLQAKRHKLADSVRLEEKEYHDAAVRAERARQDWDSVMFKSANHLQNVEEERRKFLQETGVKYVNVMSSMAPKYVQICDKMRDNMNRVDLNLDIQSIISERGTSPNIQEQILCDFYAEDMVNLMNKDRRLEFLHRYAAIFTEDIQKELKSREGMGHLAQVYRDTPNFATEEGQMEVGEKLQHSDTMLRFLQACLHKVHATMADVDGLEKPRHPLQRFMERDRSKGLNVTILRIPEWVARDLKPDQNGDIQNTAAPGSPINQALQERGSRASSAGSGHGSVGRKEGFRQSVMVQSHIYPQSPTHQSFDQVDHGSGMPEAPPSYSEACKGRCRALYDYQARMPDELTLKVGDIILIHAKQSDGWWRGELRGKMGAFPACYVEEV